MAHKKSIRTLDLTPDHGEMIKPAETIDIAFAQGLSLNDRRCWNTLIANAFGPDMGHESTDFKIDLAELRQNHNSNERVEDTIEKLMRTIARCKMPDGSVTRFQLLGGNNMGDPTRPRGELTYSFDKHLVEAVKDSISFGKLEIAVMAAFNSKYALALYEHASRRVHLRHKWDETYTVEEFREILDVQPNQLKAFGNFKQRAIVPALEEVNLWAPFRLKISYKKTGQRVTSVMLQWFWKDRQSREATRTELKKSRVGRNVRARKLQETIVVLEDLDAAGDGFEDDPARLAAL